MLSRFPSSKCSRTNKLVALSFRTIFYDIEPSGSTSEKNVTREISKEPRQFIPLHKLEQLNW